MLGMEEQMSDTTASAGPFTDTSNQGGNNPSEATPGAGDEFRPITSQEDLNRVIGDRVKRARPADYDDLKAKAAKLDTIEQANKSEIERERDKASKAEAEVATLPAKVADALRTHLVALHEIDKDDAELFLTANDPELLLKQVQRLTGRASDRKKQGNRVPREGTNPLPKDDPNREFLRQMVDRG